MPAVLALLLACSELPSESCAGAPSRTHFALFGEVQKAGAPVPDVRIVAEAAPVLPPGSCDFARPPELLSPEISTDIDGRFRLRVYSLYGPAIRCVRVTAAVSSVLARDTVALDGLRLQFRHECERPDSLGLLLQLR